MHLRNLWFGLILIGGLFAACSSEPNQTNPAATVATAVPALVAATGAPTATVSAAASAGPSSTLATTTTLTTTKAVSSTAAATSTANPNNPAYAGKIAYTGVEKNSVNIFVMTPDRTYQKQLTHGSGVSFQPQWSHDGKLIAYFQYDAQKDITTIWVADATGDPEPHLVSPATGVKTADTLSWSADNRFLVYQDVQPNSNQRDIYRLDITTSEVVNLTTDSPKFDTSPVWSPDGKFIAFVSDRANQSKGSDSIWIMAADGKNAQELTAQAGAWENTKPAWAPDSKQIAFYRWTVAKNFTAPGGPAGLWVMNADGSNEQHLVDFTDWLPSDAPVWSPDGKLIAFDYGNKDDTNVWVVPAQGGKPIQISQLPGGEKNISWSPDSKAFVFTNFQKDMLTLYIAQPDNSEPKPFFETGGNGFGNWSR